MAAKYACLPVSALADHRLQANHLRVLGALWRFRKPGEQTVSPSREELAEVAGYAHERVVSKATVDLEMMGWIDKESGEGGRGIRAVYTLYVEAKTLTGGIRVSEPNTLPSGDRVSDPKPCPGEAGFSAPPTPMIDLSSKKQEEKKRSKTQKKRVVAKADEKTPGAVAFEAYAEAYERVYGLPPVRNAATNRNFVDLVKRLGAEDAAKVAGWYPTYSAEFHVKMGHMPKYLLSDCEHLRTLMLTGRTMTSSKARQADQRQTNLSAYEEWEQGENGS